LASGLECSDLRVMAEQVELLWHYDSIYWLGSQPMHASAIAVEDIVTFSEVSGPIYKVGLSGIDAIVLGECLRHPDSRTGAPQRTVRLGISEPSRT